MEAFQPDVFIESTIEVDYDATGPLQPHVQIETFVEVDYTPPLSTGGQPNVICEVFFDVHFDPPDGVSDIIAESFIFFDASAQADVETVPVPIPPHVPMENVKIVSVTMPVPTEYDQFGRPIA